MLPMLDGDALLTLWERALAQPAAFRGDTLLRSLHEGAAATTLGQRNVWLAQLHSQWFGRELMLRSCCPACGGSAEFVGDCELLPHDAAPPAGETLRLTCGAFALEFRLPGANDVAAAAAASADDDGEFARCLLQRCVLASTRDGHSVPADALPPEVLDSLSRRIEALDPSASISFALDCPTCAQRWDARLDLAQVVWQKLQAAAERMLLDVDTLARHYGWSERDVVALSPTRRAAYVQLAAA